MAGNPNQPRIPKGLPGAGRFMKVGQALSGAVHTSTPKPRGRIGAPSTGSPFAAVAARLTGRETNSQLRDIATAQGVRVRTRDTKAQLLQALGHTTPPASSTPGPPAGESAAVARQRRVDAVRPIADLAAEIEGLHGNEVDLDVARRRIDAHARRTGSNELADKIRDLPSTEDMVRVAREHARAKGLHAIGQAGDVEPFDPKRHQAIGRAPRPGQKVEIIRPGHEFDPGDGRVTLAKATVEPAEEAKACLLAGVAAKLSRAPKADTRPKLADLMQDPSWDLPDAEFHAEVAKRHAAARKVVDGEYAGLRVQADPEQQITDGRRVMIGGTIHKGSRTVGKFERNLYRDRDGKLLAFHSFLELDPDMQGSGFAREFNAHLLDWYRANGVDRVETHANIDVGGYTWASAGFDFRDDAAVAEWAVKAKSRLASLRGTPVASPWGGVGPSRRETALASFPKLTPEQVDDQLQQFEDLLARAEAGQPVSAYEFSQLGRQPGMGRDDMWVGKLVMIGTDWNGALRL